MEDKKELITFVVQRKHGQKAIDTALANGATGATYYFARGTGVRERIGFLGKLIEAEKVLVLVVAKVGESDRILDSVSAALELNKPGNGFAYVQTVDKVVGYVEKAPSSK